MGARDKGRGSADTGILAKQGSECNLRVLRRQVEGSANRGFALQQKWIGKYQPKFWIVSQQGHLIFQVMGKPEIVAIEECKVCAGCPMNARIPRGTGSAIGLLDITNAAKIGRQGSP